VAANEAHRPPGAGAACPSLANALGNARSGKREKHYRFGGALLPTDIESSRSSTQWRFCSGCNGHHLSGLFGVAIRVGDHTPVAGGSSGSSYGYRGDMSGHHMLQ